MPDRSLRYLLVLAGTLIGGLALAWAWVVVAPLAFLDPEYPYWRAKQALLDRCDLGRVLVLGDSRAAVDIMPPRIAVPVTNLAVGGGEAIEARAALARPPQRPQFSQVHKTEPNRPLPEQVRPHTPARSPVAGNRSA
jgi:hypothetical protein